MKHLFLSLLAAGPLLSGCQVPSVFSRSSSTDPRDGQVSSTTDRPSRLFGLNKPTVEELLQAGQQEFEQQSFTAAIPLYEQVIDQEPANVSAHHRLAVIYDLQQNYSEAERHYRAALDASPMNANIIGDLGYSYLLQNRLAEAEQYLTRSRSLDPTLKNVVQHLGTVYARQGNWAKSQQMFAQILPPDQVQAEMLKWGMPPGPAGASPATPANPNANIASQQTPSSTPPESASPETLELWERMEQARLQSEAQRAQQEQQRRELDAYQRQQAAAAGYPNDPEGERLRSQMSQIDRSALPNNGGTLVLGPSGTQGSNSQMPAQTGVGAWPQSVPPGAANSPGASHQSPWSNGVPAISASQQTQLPPSSGAPAVGAQATPSTGQFQQAPVYRGPGSGQGTSPQIAGQSTQQMAPIQQVGGNTGVPNTVHQAYGVGQQSQPERAHYEVGQQPIGTVPQGQITQVGSLNAPLPQPGNTQPAVTGDVNAFDAATRSAAIMGLGVGGGQMFPIATPLAPQVSPGTGSMMNGGMYPEVERQLPTDRLQDFNQSFRYQPAGSMQSQAVEMSSAPNSLGQTMPSVMTQSQLPGASGMPASPWQSNAGTGSSAIPVNPLAEYDAQRAQHDAQVQQAVQQTQGVTPSQYMVAPSSELNPQVPVVTGTQLIMNSPPGATQASPTNPWPARPASFTTPSSQQGYGTSQFSNSQQTPLTQPPTLSQQQPLGQSPLTQQGASASQGQPVPGQQSASPYYPTNNQLAPSPWDSVPRIDPTAAQATQAGGAANDYVNPPAYNPYDPAAPISQGAGTAPPSAASNFPTQPANAGPVIRPR